MTVVDHPLRQISELNLRISREMSDAACWRADLLWDAYLTLEFGERRVLLGKDGPVEMGEFRILLDEAAWWIECNGELLFDCEDVLIDDNRQRLDEVFKEKRLLHFDRSNNLSVAFSDGVALVIEKPENVSEQLLELRLANGDCVDFYADGSIETESMSQ